MSTRASAVRPAKARQMCSSTFTILRALRASCSLAALLRSAPASDDAWCRCVAGVAQSTLWEVERACNCRAAHPAPRSLFHARRRRGCLSARPPVHTRPGTCAAACCGNINVDVIDSVALQTQRKLPIDGTTANYATGSSMHRATKANYALWVHSQVSIWREDCDCSVVA
jgi:hypothetical protein